MKGSTQRVDHFHSRDAAERRIAGEDSGNVILTHHRRDPAVVNEVAFDGPGFVTHTGESVEVLGTWIDAGDPGMIQ